MTPSARSLVEGVRDALVEAIERDKRCYYNDRGRGCLDLPEVEPLAATLTTALSQPRFTRAELAALQTALSALAEQISDGPTATDSVDEQCREAFPILEGMLETREGKEPLP